MKQIIGFILGLSCALLLTLIVGENPIHILKIIIMSGFGSSYDLGLTLFYTTSLIFTGLSVCFAFKSGLFNIGAEGQLSIAALTMVITGHYFENISSPLSYIIIIFSGILAGAIWGLIPGILKSLRGSHEVIITMMMNFIAAGIASWAILNLIPNTNSQNPESLILNEQFRLNHIKLFSDLFSESPVNVFLIIALICAILMSLFFNHTVLGFEFKAVGSNLNASNRAGINSKKLIVLSLLISGVLASGAAMNEIVGFSGQYRIGFSPEFGFIGIAVALMANNNPLGIIVTAFLMGSLHKGASDLDLETNTITKDFSKILQAMIILGVSLQFYLSRLNLGQKFKIFAKKERVSWWN